MKIDSLFGKEKITKDKAKITFGNHTQKKKKKKHLKHWFSNDYVHIPTYKS